VTEEKTRRPAGKREEMSVLGVAAVVASWLAPIAEDASPGAGQVVTILIMAAVPFAAKLVRDRLGATLGQALSGEVRKARDVLTVLLAALTLGCGTMVTVGSHTPMAAQEPAEGQAAAGEPQSCGELRGVSVGVVWGKAELGCGMRGGEISPPFAAILGPWVSQALQAVPGIGAAPQAPTTVVIHGAEVVETGPAEVVEEP